jgi:VCBS repeat-containing protein
VLANDKPGPANESSQKLTVLSATAGHGKVTIHQDGSLHYVPTANYYGPDTIRYIIADNGTTNGVLDPRQANSTVAVTVTPVNDPPVAKNLAATVTEDGRVSLTLSATDIETPAASLIFTVTSLPVQGRLSTQSGAPVRVGSRFTGGPTLVYEPGAAREGIGSDGFTYTVTDSGGGTGALSAKGTVSIGITKAVADGTVTIDSAGVVRIGGTSGNDTILATRYGNSLQVQVNRHIVSTIPLGKVKELRVWGRAGDDKITVLLPDVPARLSGGAGNDVIVDGAGSSLIFGGAGNDTLVGGARNDLLVGGSGADTLVDPFGNNILVGGNVSTQFTDAFFRQALQQWSSTRSQNSQFIQGLSDDAAVDALFGSVGNDWFVLGAGDVKHIVGPVNHARTSQHP